MTTVASVLAELNAQAPGDKAAGWDAHGLQIGDPADEVMRLAVCHEVTDQVASLAVEGSVDLLISYHPLLFKPTTRLVAGPGPTGRAYRLARAGIAVGIVHTAWDATTGGTADALAAALDLTAVTRFGPIDPAPLTKLVTFVPPAAIEIVARALTEAGAGRIGNYSGCSFRSEGIGTFIPGHGAQPVIGQIGSISQEPEVRLEILLPQSLESRVVAALHESHPYEEPPFDLHEVRANLGLIGRVGNLGRPMTLGDFSNRVTAILESPGRCSRHRSRAVTRVALLPGSGGSFIEAAAATGADVYVTGDLSHHQTRAALDLGMSTIDPGHAATERPGVIKLMSVARTIMPGVIDLTEDATPWKEN
ncbi:MAG TPA: Nif3-like dinuclear metal center hexameric protein [Acidimicrobiia bacterium]|nr:Nif3-like dinuclear metal center hexameric protein [Acidimicrobiia bacterium]